MSVARSARAAEAAVPARRSGRKPPAAAPRVGRLARLRRHKRLWRALVAVAVLVGAVALYYVITLYQVVEAAKADQARVSDAIVVMGAAQFDGRPSPVLQARLDHALDLWNRKLAPLVVVTGGKLPADRTTEAATSAAYLRAHGVPAASILEEDTGRTSYQSLQSVAKLLKARKLHKVLLVSDPYHSLRIALVSDDLGLSAATSPTRTSPEGSSSAKHHELREAAGVALGRIIGFHLLERLN